MTSHFLQSKEWEEFQKSLGRNTFRIDGVLIIKLPLIFGKTYFYCGGCLTLNVKHAAELAESENAVFLKLEPMVSKSAGIVLGDFQKSRKALQPQRTITLDITKSEEQVMSGMHSKARYNIRLAGKRGLKITISKNQKFYIFWQLLQRTSRRDKFYTHAKEYYDKLLRLSITQLFIAEYQGKIIAANIILFYGDTAYYLHGASDYEHRSLMAPYLLHWETIKYAKERGYKKYDFWGIDEKKWPGVTRFKKGFGGREIEYVGSYDCVLEPFWYKLYKLRSFIKRTF